MKKRRWDTLLSRIPENKVLTGAEVGVWVGQTARHVLIHRPFVTHVMIDPWQAARPGDGYYGTDGIAKEDQEYFDKCYRKTIEATSFAGSRAVILRQTSEQAASISDKIFHYVFIDAQHTYNGVLDDIRLWLPLIVPGGFIGGHDYGQDRFPGVKRAVDEIFPEVEVDDDHTWFVKREG